MVLAYQLLESPSETQASTLGLSFQLAQGLQLWFTSELSTELKISDIWPPTQKPFHHDLNKALDLGLLFFCKKELHMTLQCAKVGAHFPVHAPEDTGHSLPPVSATFKPCCWASLSSYFFKCRMATNIFIVAPYSKIICVKPLYLVACIDIIEDSIQGSWPDLSCAQEPSFVLEGE